MPLFPTAHLRIALRGKIPYSLGMNSLALSADSQKFLDEHVESEEDLQILLLLRKEPTREWDALEIAAQVGLEPIAASNRMMRLYLRGLLQHPPKTGRLFHYRHTTNRRVEKCLSELASVFESSRLEVVNLILRKQANQFRTFSEAFRVGRDPKNG